MRSIYVFDDEFQIQLAINRDELFPNWAQYGHDFDVAEQEEYDEQHSDMAEQDLIAALYDLEQVDALDAGELARQEALYGARDLLSEDEAEK